MERLSRKKERSGTMDEMATKNRRISGESDSSMSLVLHSSLKLGLIHGQEEAVKGYNFVFSPLSVRVTLGLLAGMLDETEQRSVLSFVNSATLDDLNTASATLIHACRPTRDETVMKIYLANGIWASESETFDASLENAKSIYKASIKRVNFSTQYLETRKEINDWIKKKTVGLIKDFLPNGTPDSSTSYVLANALYFKGIWDDNIFDSSNTKTEKFHLLDQSTVKVPLMSTSNSRYELYSSYEGFKTIALPYKKDHPKAWRSLSLIVFLPDKKDGLIDLMKKMTSNPHFIDHHLPKSKDKLDLIKMPKFKISSKFDLTDSLKKMGFDISCMNILHGSTIKVDEKGTIAAAVTAVIHVGRCEGSPPRTPKQFIADHPFMYVIRENVSGAILFLGHVVNP